MQRYNFFRQMSKHKHHKSTLARVASIRAITEQHYEIGNNSRCYKWVWRYHVYPAFGCCYRTYLNYLGIPTPPPVQQEDKRQLSLFDLIEENPAD